MVAHLASKKNEKERKLGATVNPKPLAILPPTLLSPPPEFKSLSPPYQKIQTSPHQSYQNLPSSTLPKSNT